MALIDNYLNKKLIQVINKSINDIYINVHMYILFLREKIQFKSQSTVRYQGSTSNGASLYYLEFILSTTRVETTLGRNS